MRASLSASLDLPAGSIICLDDTKTSFCLAWESSRGLHIIHSETNTDGLCPSEFTARIREAAVEFKFVIALEVLDEKMADLGD
jgi:hypothetical protein